MVSSLILLIIGLAFMLKGYSKGLLVVLLISLTNGLFTMPLGVSFPIHYALALLYTPLIFRYYFKYADHAKRIFSPLLIEIIYLVFLALIFGFLFPWRSEYDYLRTWSQLAEGRAIVQIIRFVADISLVFTVYYLLFTEKVSFDFLIKSFATVITLTVLIAVLNYLMHNRIKLFLFPEIARDIVNRFTGLNNEPRGLGRVCSVSALFLLSFINVSNRKITIVAIVLSLIGVILSLSASAYLMTLSWLVIIFINTRRVKVIIGTTALLLIASIYITKSEVFQNQTQKKLERVFATNNSIRLGFTDQIDNDEPRVLTRFEVFDRAALNFLYRHPLFSIIGTGPNLISIPASPYLSKSSKAIYGERIDSVPHSLFVNILARSGIIGLFLWYLLFKRMLVHVDTEKRVFFIGLIISTFLVSNELFYFYLALLLFFSETGIEREYDHA